MENRQFDLFDPPKPLPTEMLVFILSQQASEKRKCCVIKYKGTSVFFLIPILTAAASED